MLREFIAGNCGLLLETIRELCAIPAPSYHEDVRAAYCKDWLEKAGAEGVYIDEAKNAVFPLGCEESDGITAFAAHLDTVFPDMEPMPLVEDDEKICCPGVGDNTASAAILLLTAKYYIEKKIMPLGGILFVFNSCEEGLGNLKGVRKLFADYEGRIARFISFDSHLDTVNDACAGSHRYRVDVFTEGGHSFLKFGNASAVTALSKMICAMDAIEMPVKPGTRTTHNVGLISGGTSVNTIPQSASMLCEYRSTDRECLAYMQAQFERIFEEARSEKVRVEVDRIGDRPCSNIDDAKIAVLRRIAAPVIEEVIGKTVQFTSSSTDCNIPLSMGIPALCIGVYNGGGMHTREEWVEKASLPVGLEVAIRIAGAMTAFEEE